MRKKLFLIIILFLTACATPQDQITDVSLQAYLTSTPALTNTPNIITIIETPLPTNTPMIYTIESGDTISEIAEKFNVSQADLRAANPNINPNALTIG